MPEKSHAASIALHRLSGAAPAVPLLNPAVPLAKRMPARGLIEDGETPLAAAQREFAEELGLLAPEDQAPRRYATSAGRTRRAISAPLSRSAMAMSYCPCRSIQNCAPLPK